MLFCRLFEPQTVFKGGKENKKRLIRVTVQFLILRFRVYKKYVIKFSTLLYIVLVIK